MKSTKNIGIAIKENRKKVGISQVRLSQELGYKNGQFISNVERGLCSIPLKKVQRVSQALKVPMKVFTEALVSDYKEHISRTLSE